MFNGDASMRKQVSYRSMKTIDISSFKGLNIFSKVTYGIIISLSEKIDLYEWWLIFYDVNEIL